MALEDFSGCRIMQFPKGAFILKNSDFKRDLYVVKTGKVRVLKQVGMRVISLSDIGPGGVFGEVSAIDGGPRSASVQALEDTELHVIPPQEFKQRTASLPEWFLKIARILVQRLRETDSRIEAEGMGGCEYNILLLLNYFLMCEGKAEADGSRTIEFRKLQGELIDLLRVQISTLTQIFDSLKEKGIAEVRKDLLVVPKPEKLDEYVKNLHAQASKAVSV